MVNTPTEVREGQVAKILNKRELVINIGSDQGIELDVKFRIMHDPILDPATHAVLGTLDLDREKIKVKVFHVQPKLCVARTYETYVVEAPLSPFLALNAALGRRTVTQVRTIRTSEQDSEALDDNNDVIRVGDRAVLIEGDDKGE